MEFTDQELWLILRAVSFYEDAQLGLTGEEIPTAPPVGKTKEYYDAMALRVRLGEYLVPKVLDPE